VVTTAVKLAAARQGQALGMRLTHLVLKKTITIRMPFQNVQQQQRLHQLETTKKTRIDDQQGYVDLPLQSLQAATNSIITSFL